MDAEYQAQMTSDDGRPPDHDAFSEGDDAVSELESAEQYVRAHELIESMRAERRPEREAGSEEEARLSATAALLRAAASGSGAVDPIFAERLFARLEAEQAALTTGSAATQPRVTAQAPASPQSPAAAAAAPGQPSQAPIPVRQVGLSRRRALLGGLGAAAAALTGAAVTAAIEQSGKQQPPAPPASSLVIPGRGTWVAIATLDAMPVGAVKRFEAGAVIGYLQHTASGFMALSGVCTHMACLLQWNAGDKTFDCPCHGGRFLSNGTAAPGGRYDYAPLPPIQTKVEAQQVWVYVTGGAQSDEFPAPDVTATQRSGYGAANPEINK